MKYAPIILLLLIGSGCRSSRNTTDTSFSDHSTETKKEVKSETILSEVSTLSVLSTATDTQIKEYFRTTHFNVDGSVSAVQEQWRDTRRNELVDSTGQRTDVSGINRSDSTITETNNDIEAKQKTKSDTDSRPVQGVEWLYVAGVIGVVAVIIIIISIVWLKKKRLM